MTKLRRALNVMGKVERQELDRRRRVLGELDQTMAELERRGAELRRRFASEMEQGWALPDGARLIAAWAPAHHHQVQNLAQQRQQLQELRDRQAAAVVAQHTEVRRLELLHERATMAERDELARKDAAAIDELAVLRHRGPARSR